MEKKNVKKLAQERENLEKVFSYWWKDRPNKRTYQVKVTENGRLVSFNCSNEHGRAIYMLDFSRGKWLRKNPWHLPAGSLVPEDNVGGLPSTSDHPIILKDQLFYNLRLLKPAPKVEMHNELSSELMKKKKTKIFCYDFSDERNQRTYSVWFHENGYLEGYRSYKDTRTYKKGFKEDLIDDVLHEHPASVDASAYIWKDMVIEGKFELVELEREEKGKTRIFWYEIFDKHNQRSYRLGFHEDGDMVGYTSYKDILIKNLLVDGKHSTEDPDWFSCEKLRMVGKIRLKTAKERNEEITVWKVRISEIDKLSKTERGLS